MPRHRAPQAPSPMRLALSTIAVTGAAVGSTAAVSLPASASGFGDHVMAKHHRHGDHDRGRDNGRHRHGHRHAVNQQVRQVTNLRTPTSGEEQYRNGCRRGYISDGCGLYSVHSMLRRGINPFL